MDSLGIYRIVESGYRRINNDQIKYLCIFVILAANSAVSQNEHSSLGMILGTPEKVTIAVDSRRNLGNDQFIDTVCKLAAFDGKLAFFAVNFTYGHGWESRDEARSVWEARPKTADITWIATQWGGRVKARFESDYARDPLGMLAKVQGDPRLVRGVFVMISAGRIVMAVTTITFDRNYFAKYHVFKVEPSVAPNLDWSGTHLLPYGHPEIVAEYAPAFFTPQPLSRRSAEWAAAMRVKLDSVPIAKRDAALLEELGNQTTELHPRGVAVHGPYDILEMSPQGGIHWIKRKDNCPAN